MKPLFSYGSYTLKYKAGFAMVTYAPENLHKRLQTFWTPKFLLPLLSAMLIFSSYIIDQMQNQINNDNEDDDLDFPPVPFLNRELSHEEDDLNVGLNFIKGSSCD